MPAPAQGALANLAMDSVLPFDTSSEAFEFIQCGLKMIQSHAETGGIRGTRSRNASRVRINAERIAGPIVLEPSATELDRLWPRILGGATSGGVTAVAETLPEFQVMVDKVTDVFTYANCKVARATISGAEGSNIRLGLEIEGETEAGSGTFPVITIDTENQFIFSDIALTLSGSTRVIQEFTLTIDNMLDAGRFMNATTRTEIPAHDRAVSLSCVVPYDSDNSALYDQSVAGAAGILVCTDGTDTYTFNFGNVKVAADGPEVPGKAEILLPLNLNCYKTGSDDEIKVTKT